MPPGRLQGGWIATCGAGRVDASPVVVRATAGEWAAPNPTVPDPASLVPTVRRALSVSSCHQHLSPEHVGTARAEVQNHTHRHPVHGLLLDIVTPHPRQSSQSPREDTATLHRQGPGPAAYPGGLAQTQPVSPPTSPRVAETPALSPCARWQAKRPDGREGAVSRALPAPWSVGSV